ncbi:MAG: isoprenoid biosynthesis glyoxalase ElbB [Crocinitomicaceae bacterium]
MKVGILLSGCGVYDGAEIHESVLTMLALEELGVEYVCISIDKEQHHVVNHLTGEEVSQTRNMMQESARIARGKVINIKDIDPVDIEGLIIPGGFGSAKNFTDWAFKGNEGSILPEVKLLVVNMVNVGRPILALCVSPVVVAKSLEGSINTKMTIGSKNESSPYDIGSFEIGLQNTGVETLDKSIREVEVDVQNKIITAPCYMMDASLLEVRKNIQQGINEMIKFI